MTKPTTPKKKRVSTMSDDQVPPAPSPAPTPPKVPPKPPVD